MRRAPGHERRRRLGVAAPALLASSFLGGSPSRSVVLAHGETTPSPSVGDVLGAWTFDPLVCAAIAVAGWVYVVGVRRTKGWPRARSWCAGLGLAALVVATAGPPAVYEDVLFWVHMVQHLLLTLVAAPLLAFSAPVALALRSGRARVREPLLRMVHARPVRLLTHPVVSWGAFGLVMWGTHFSGIYDAALENEIVHRLEHVLYLAAALLFWAPVAGLDPTRRVARPLRVVYLLAAIPVQSFLGLAVYSADEPLYDHYEGLGRIWGPGVMDDQQIAGATMWIGGDVLLLGWAGVAAAAWLRAEEREGERADRRAGRAKASPEGDALS